VLAAGGVLLWAGAGVEAVEEVSGTLTAGAEFTGGTPTVVVGFVGAVEPPVEAAPLVSVVPVAGLATGAGVDTVVVLVDVFEPDSTVVEVVCVAPVVVPVVVEAATGCE